MSPVDLVLPIENAPWSGGPEALVNRDYRWVRIVGRLRPGVSAGAVSADASAVYRRANVGVRSVDQTTLAREVIAVRSLSNARHDPKSQTSRIAVWLAALAAVVLLIACANVASLLVARGIGDAHELAIHMALGASRMRLAARSLLEVAVMSVAAVACALVAATLAGKALVTLLLGNALAAPPLDVRSASVAAIVGVFTCLACVVAPIVRAARTSPHAALGHSSRTTTVSHCGALRGLVAVQIALGVVLVSQAAVLVASLRNATRVDLGFDLSRLVVVDVDLRAAGFTKRRQSMQEHAPSTPCAAFVAWQQQG